MDKLNQVTVTFLTKSKKYTFKDKSYKDCHNQFLDYVKCILPSFEIKDEVKKVIIKSGYYIITLPYKKFHNWILGKGGLNE
jgi:hypothetical protein